MSDLVRREEKRVVVDYEVKRSDIEHWKMGPLLQQRRLGEGSVLKGGRLSGSGIALTQMPASPVTEAILFEGDLHWSLGQTPQSDFPHLMELVREWHRVMAPIALPLTGKKALELYVGCYRLNELYVSLNHCLGSPQVVGAMAFCARGFYQGNEASVGLCEPQHANLWEIRLSELNLIPVSLGAEDRCWERARGGYLMVPDDFNYREMERRLAARRAVEVAKAWCKAELPGFWEGKVGERLQSQITHAEHPYCFGKK